MLSGAPAQPILATPSTLTFTLAVPAREELGSVRVVIFSGPTSHWDDRVAAVTSDPITVVPAAKLLATDNSLRPLPVFEQRPDSAVVRTDSAMFQGIIALLWTAAGIGWWRRRTPVRTRLSSAAAGNASWLLPAAACATAAAWTTLPMETLIGAVARDHFILHRWDGGRTDLQLALTSLLVAVSFGFGLNVWRKTPDRARRLAWLGLGLYGLLALVSLRLLHEVDALLAKPILNGSVLQLEQLTVAVLALIGSASPR